MSDPRSTSDPRERVLQHALRRHYRGEEGDPELARRIASAWDRGVRGSLDPDEVERVGAEPELSTPARPTRPARNGAAPAPRGRLLHLAPAAGLAAAAAALLIAGGLGWRELRTPASPPVLARADAELVLLRGPDGVPLRGTEVLAGDTVVSPDGPATLRLPGGAVLQASPASVLALAGTPEAPEITLAGGRVELASGTGALVLRAGFARLTLDEGSEASASVALETPEVLGSLAPEELARRLGDPALEEPRTLDVRVLRGHGELVWGTEREEVGAASGARTLSSRPGFVPAEDEERFETLFVVVCVERAQMTRKGMWASFEKMDVAMEDLSRLLARVPPLWGLMRARVTQERSSPSLLPQVQAAFTTCVLDVLQNDLSPESLAYGRALWLEAPEAFLETHQVAFAERGAFEFQRELEALVEAWKSDPGFDAEPPLLAAAYLALQGDDAGAELLKENLGRPDYGNWVTLSTLVSGLALDALGDPGAWEEVRGTIRTEVLALLDGEEVGTAAGLLLTFEVFAELREEEGTLRLGRLGLRVLRHVDAHQPQAMDEAQVRRLLRELLG